MMWEPREKRALPQMMSFSLLVLFLLLSQGTIFTKATETENKVGKVFESNWRRYETPYPNHTSCCYGSENYEHGEVVLSLPSCCLQLECQDGNITQQYHNQPGDSGCCEFAGQMYPEGTRLPSYCVILVCSGSQWVCGGGFDDCCAQCTVYDDPHIVTFDQYQYDFHGTCNYSLAQTDASYHPPAGVFADFTACNTASCLRYTVFKDNPNTVIHIDALNVFNLKVNGEPVHVGMYGVQQIVTVGAIHPVLAFRTGSCVVLVGASRIMVRHCRHRVDILVHPLHTDGLDGLCGHYNTYAMDDFTSRNGDVLGLQHLPLAFPLSWKTADQADDKCKKECPEVFSCKEGQVTPDHNQPDHCKARQQGSRVWSLYLLTCKQLLGTIVAGEESLQHHIGSCAFDLCLLREQEAGQKAEKSWMQEVAEITQEGLMILRAFRGTMSEWQCWDLTTSTTSITSTSTTSTSTTTTSTTTTSTKTTTKGTNWIPSGDNCVLNNDPHIRTFDKYNYDYHGTCNYSLAQTDSTYDPPVGVFSDFRPCGSASCLHETVFKDNTHTVIHIIASDRFNLRVNGELVVVVSTQGQQLSTSGGLHPVIVYKTGLCVVLKGESGITVRQCKNSVQVFAEHSLLNTLDGLCGHYSRTLADDFTSRNGTVYALNNRPLPFPLSWITEGQAEARCYNDCPEKFGCDHVTLADPCKARETKSSKWFQYMRRCALHLTYTLKDVQQDRRRHIENCAFDICLLYESKAEESEVNMWLHHVQVMVCEEYIVWNATTENDWWRCYGSRQESKNFMKNEEN